MADIDPKELAESLMDENGRLGGALPFCIRNHQCARKLTCELAHSDKRGRSVNVADYFQGRATDLRDCSNWRPRKELNSQLDVPRRKPGSGSRHNAHAPDRTRAREALGLTDIPDLTKGQGQLKDAFNPNAGGRLILPGLPQEPDLNVTRHIKHGRNIKDEDN